MSQEGKKLQDFTQNPSDGDTLKQESTDQSASKDYKIDNRPLEASTSEASKAVPIEETTIVPAQEQSGSSLHSSIGEDLTTDPRSDSKEYSAGSSTRVSPQDPSLTCEEIVDDSGDDPLIDISYDVITEEKEVVHLMNKMRVNHYTASNSEEDGAYSKCRGLFEKDYVCEIVDNYGGKLSNHYPIRIIIPVRSKTSECEGGIEFDNAKYTKQVENAISSRCRTRFAAPVILIDNKFICRAATLSVRKGAVLESARKQEPPQAQYVRDNIFNSLTRFTRNLVRSIAHVTARTAEATMNLVDVNSMDKIRERDVQILKELKIHLICDLMIEDRKMYKQIIRVSSSEKINRSIYGDFAIEQMPYPGCQFFRRYHAAGYRPEELVFNWNRADVNVELQLTEDLKNEFSDIQWEKYKEWDVVELTKNYMKVLLLCIIKGTGGVLVHCISGWDRTPLIISLLRISLWADGIIHESLGVLDMAYLTLGYDWYLFGHNLPARLKLKEEIMHFCFNFLPYIASDEFSATRIFKELPAEQKADKKFPEFRAGLRYERICQLSYLILEIYRKRITEKMIQTS